MSLFTRDVSPKGSASLFALGLLTACCRLPILSLYPAFHKGLALTPVGAGDANLWVSSGGRGFLPLCTCCELPRVKVNLISVAKLDPLRVPMQTPSHTFCYGS